jgi:hypothetical protein
MELRPETTMDELLREALSRTYFGILNEVIHRLRESQPIHMEGLDYRYPASELLPLMGAAFGRDSSEIEREYAPTWLTDVEALLKKIEVEHGLKAP